PYCHSPFGGSRFRVLYSTERHGISSAVIFFSSGLELMELFDGHCDILALIGYQ
ncbi:hypothetical protein Gotri_003693, partial [Gossypium trilobum]|nr:hypothetical protein [Gossypium trilobum]